MQYAQVTNGIVTGLSDTLTTSNIIPCGDAVRVGWLYSNGACTPKIPTPYDIRNWYWCVNNSTTQVYSTASIGYVQVTDSTYAAWLAGGNTPILVATEEVLEDFLNVQYPAGWIPSAERTAQTAALTALNAGVMISSVSTPALNATYSTNPNSVNNINAITTFILVNGTFPGGATSMPWADASGTMHMFPSVDVFKTFATAFATYVALVSVYGDSGGTIGSLPSNQIAIA